MLNKFKSEYSYAGKMIMTVIRMRVDLFLFFMREINLISIK